MQCFKSDVFGYILIKSGKIFLKLKDKNIQIIKTNTKFEKINKLYKLTMKSKNKVGTKQTVMTMKLTMKKFHLVSKYANYPTWDEKQNAP